MNRALKTLLLLFAVTTLTQCAQQQAYEKLPELINEDTGLREFRFRSADCINTVYQHIPSNCDHRQQIITEKNPDSGKDRVLIRELTPDLREKFKTIVSPTVQYDEKNGKIYVSATMRINESSDRDFTELKYSFEGDLKTFRDKYKSDPSLRYIHLVKRTGPSEKLNGAVYCVEPPHCEEVALVFSFLNPGPDGQLLVDSKTFTIDNRETEKAPTDVIPGKAEPRTLDIKIVTVEFPDEFDVDDIANPEIRDAFGNVKAPILPKDPSGALCAGLIEDQSSCPDYIYDSTQKNPLHDNADSEEEGTVDVFNMDIDAKPSTPQDSTSLDTPTTETPTQVETPQTTTSTQATDATTTDSATPSKQDTPKTGGEVTLIATLPDDEAPQVDSNLNVDSNPPKTEDGDTPNVVLPTENVPIPRPRPRPDHLMTPPAASETQTPPTQADLTPAEVLAQIPDDQIPRPKPRPDHLMQNTPPQANSKLQLLSVDGRFVFDLGKCSQQLNRLQTGVFNQSRGLYYSNGRLNNGKRYSKSSDINRPNDGRKSKQYASDLTLLTVEYAACVMEQKYPKAKIDIHDFSLQRGGELAGHSSHQNGLDVDLSYPHIDNKTQGFDVFTNYMPDARVEAAMDYAKILYSTERVHIIFTDTAIQQRFCKYMKDKGRLTPEYKDFINKNFRHIQGHRNHYHVRMKCNSQNVYCQPQGPLITHKVCD